MFILFSGFFKFSIIKVQTGKKELFQLLFPLLSLLSVAVTLSLLTCRKKICESRSSRIVIPFTIGTFRFTFTGGLIGISSTGELAFF